jgi:hypothetical protein
MKSCWRLLARILIGRSARSHRDRERLDRERRRSRERKRRSRSRSRERKRRRSRERLPEPEIEELERPRDRRERDRERERERDRKRRRSRSNERERVAERERRRDKRERDRDRERRDRKERPDRVERPDEDVKDIRIKEEPLDGKSLSIPNALFKKSSPSPIPLLLLQLLSRPLSDYPDYNMYFAQVKYEEDADQPEEKYRIPENRPDQPNYNYDSVQDY